MHHHSIYDLSDTFTNIPDKWLFDSSSANNINSFECKTNFKHIFEFVSDSTYVEFGSIQIASGGFLVTFCGAGVTSMAFSYCDFPLGRIETTKALYDEYGGKPHFVTHHASSKVKCVPDTHKA